MKREENTNAKAPKVGLYDPYLDVVGGGEKHILSILKVLDEKGYKIEVFFDQNLSSSFDKKLNLRFKNLAFAPNVFKNHSQMSKLLALKNFDYFFYVTDGSYFLSTAKKNFVFAMVPKQELYSLNAMNRLKLHNFKFITNSLFTKQNLKKCGVDAQIIYPYIDTPILKINNTKKKKIILSVGRFFGQLHSKKHDKIIEAFEELQKNKKFADCKLVLAGGLKDEDSEYFNSIEKLAKRNSTIILLPNISYEGLKKLYQESFIFWHFTGFGVDEEKEPQKVEHLGIAPLEAMTSGAVTFCYRAGGPKELIEDGVNGFLFSTTKELIEKTTTVMSDPQEVSKIQMNAQKYVKENFSYDKLRERVEKVILKT